MYRSAMFMMSITWLVVVLLAVGAPSVQGRTATDYSGNNHVCTIRDTDDELRTCAGSGSRLYLYNNAISSIQAGAFDGLSALTYL